MSKYKNRYVEDDIIASKDLDEFQKIKVKILEETFREHGRLVHWLYFNHRDVLREFEDQFHAGMRIHFLQKENERKLNKQCKTEIQPNSK
jgi:hypothetical protein